MAERIPLPALSGDLSPLVAVDHTIATILAATTLVSASVNVQTAPPSGAATLEIRRSGNVLATVTIAQGQRAGSWTGSVAVNPGDVLELRVTGAGGGASDLSGRLAFGADVMLTSVDRVREYAGLQGSSSDALLLEICAGVTAAIEAACGRALLVRSYTETHRPNGGFDTITLGAFPVLASPAPTVTEDGAPLAAGTDFEIDAASGILRRLASGEPASWSKGSVVVVAYSAGYSTVPTDLRLAATKQARHEYRQTQPGGDRLGNRSLALETGGQTTYELDGLLPSVRAAISPYAEVARLGS